MRSLFSFLRSKKTDSAVDLHQPARAPEARREQVLRFLHEQDGPNERILKSELSSLFSTRREVRSAFLVHVDFGKQTTDHDVALCLRAREDTSLVNDVATVFERLVGRNVHMDVLFLTAVTEQKVRQVCRPFYEAG